MPRKPGATAAAKAAKPKTVKDRAFYAMIGKKGGEQTARSHSPVFYAEIGRKGGEATKKRHGATHYANIGMAGAAKRSAK